MNMWKKLKWETECFVVLYILLPVLMVASKLLDRYSKPKEDPNTYGQ